MTADVIPIRSQSEALEWGDSWERAYRALYRSVDEETRRLQHQILMLEVRITIERAERSLERIELQDEIKRLRGS